MTSLYTKARGTIPPYSLSLMPLVKWFSMFLIEIIYYTWSLTVYYIICTEGGLFPFLDSVSREKRWPSMEIQ